MQGGVSLARSLCHLHSSDLTQITNLICDDLLHREPALTTRTSDFAGCLDYVWVTPQHFSVTGTLALPYPDIPGWRDPMDIAFLPIPGESYLLFLSFIQNLVLSCTPAFSHDSDPLIMSTNNNLVENGYRSCDLTSLCVP